MQCRVTDGYVCDTQVTPSLCERSVVVSIGNGTVAYQLHSPLDNRTVSYSVSLTVRASAAQRARADVPRQIVDPVTQNTSTRALRLSIPPKVVCQGA